MIHGMWGGAWYWKRFRTFFQERGYHCIVPDLRYHDVEPGAAPHPELGTTGLLDYAYDLEELLRGLDETPIIMGHSMGGLLAQMLASRGLADAAVLLAPASPHGILALRPSVISSFWSGLTRWGFWRRPLIQTFDEAVYGMLHLLSREDQQATYDRFVHESGRAATEIGFWIFDRKKAAYVDQRLVTCPVLVVSGAQDRITPASVSRRVAAKYESVSTHREFPDHAHWVIAEPGWEEIAEYVSGWLEALHA
jgi:pimeloyl-ACP methyl ester carboxylesterase